MPELPEVNTFKKYFEETSLKKRIVEVLVHDDKIIRNMSGPAFADHLTGRTFNSAYRQGKYLFGELDNGHSILFHFAMTGDFKYYIDPSERPRHERFAFRFTNGDYLGFDCPRKFAKILYLENRSAYLQKIKLGPDALLISEEEFLEKTKGRKGSVKGFLLNQSHLAGVGNLYADEACFQARIHPASRMDKIPKKKKIELFRTLQNVLSQAVNERPYYKDYPDEWLWEKWRADGKLAPDGKSKVGHETIAGRTTFYAKGWQKKY